MSFMFQCLDFVRFKLCYHSDQIIRSVIVYYRFAFVMI